MKLLILGHAGHGKDTVASFITKYTGLRVNSSSMVVAPDIVMPWLAARGYVYPSVEACYADRGNHRAEWHEAIAAFNTPNKAKLGRLIFAKYDMYSGLRSHEEWLAIKQEKLYDYSIWVDRSVYISPEPTSSMRLGPYAADFVVNNNGTLYETELQCKRIAKQFLRPKDEITLTFKRETLRAVAEEFINMNLSQNNMVFEQDCIQLCQKLYNTLSLSNCKNVTLNYQEKSDG